MWCQRLVAPYTFERIDIPEPDPESLAERQVLLRFLAAGICGSDLPGFKGTQGKLPGDTGPCAAGIDGFPIHEIVGEVLASRHPDHAVGDRVVGWASGFDGLMDIVRSDGDGLVSYDPALGPELAIGLQPLACVLYALEQVGDLTGKRVAIIGQGSIGLLFAYVAKALGASHITGVDPVDRSALSVRVFAGATVGAILLTLAVPAAAAAEWCPVRASSGTPLGPAQRLGLVGPGVRAGPQSCCAPTVPDCRRARPWCRPSSGLQ